MDSTEIPVYGQQENSAYNGHVESTCYHPLLLFSREGDCLAAKVRPGNVHSAEDWEEPLLPEIERQQKLGKEIVFRARPRGYPGLRPAGDLRGAGEARREVRHPHSVRRQFGAGHQAVKMTRLSCHRFRSNEVRLWLSLIAYNLGNLWRRVPFGPGVAEEDRELAADQLAAKAGENRRSFDQARAVLLAAAGREPTDQATVWEHGTADRCADGGYRVAGGR
jgi:hypothetical protein